MTKLTLFSLCLFCLFCLLDFQIAIRSKVSLKGLVLLLLTLAINFNP